MAITLSGARSHTLSIDFLGRLVGESKSETSTTDEFFDKVLRLLEHDQYDAVFALTNFGNIERLQNLRAIAMMRSGRPKEAVTILRRHVIDANTLELKAGVPLHMQSNLATALFMAGHVAGSQELLEQLPLETDLQLQMLAANIKSWENSLSRLKWLDWKICGIEHVNGLIPLDFIPGETGLPRSNVA